MILVDTSVWVDHLRRGSTDLAALLDRGEVCCHPFVIGELACGNLRRRAEVLAHLQALPQASLADHEEALQLLSEQELHGVGLGWIDIHLLASALLSGCRFWTHDKHLAAAARDLRCGA
ncbi:MAG: type II toxin-antitoxin system VapC family toxin [Planctomycetota bacterium]|nr:MAG: type II toxin-antitoxin system VapC family toxin [Planctomycetota bacterium]